MQKIIIGIIIIAVLAGAWFFMKQNAEPTITMEESAVAAIVNGEEITGEDVRDQIAQITSYRNVRFSNLSDAEQKQIYNEVLDSLIQQTVLEQAVKAERISVSSEAIDAALTAAATTAGSQEALEAQLASADKDMGDLRDEIKTGLLNEAYFNAKLPLAEITVSEEEIKDRYAIWVENATAANEPLPTLETDRAIIEAEIRGLKREEIINAHLQTLVEAADVTKH